MKIHIIGAAGSGKSHLARRLSEATGIRASDLDELFWDNRSESYGERRDSRERDLLLSSITSGEDWIMEGVYYKWTGEPLRAADRVLYLDTPHRLQVLRIIRRFVLRKIGWPGRKKKETLQSLFNLLKWNRSYNGELRGFIDRLLRERRVEVLRNKKDAAKTIQTVIAARKSTAPAPETGG